MRKCKCATNPSVANHTTLRALTTRFYQRNKDANLRALGGPSMIYNWKQLLYFPNWAPILWVSGIPPKHCALAWLAVQGALPTAVFLEARGIPLTINQMFCSLCKSFMETTDHLMLHCVVSWSIWGRVVQWWGVSWALPRTFGDAVWLWKGMGSNHWWKSWVRVCYIVVWHIWLLRNGAVFNGVMDVCDVIFGKIQNHSFCIMWQAGSLRALVSFPEWQHRPGWCIRPRRRRRSIVD